MDEKENPAVTALTRMPPAMLEEFANNPAALEKHARILLAANIDIHHRKMRLPDASPEMRQKFMTFLADIGNLSSSKAAKAAAAGGNAPGFSVNIVLNSPVELTRKPVVAEVIENQAK